MRGTTTRELTVLVAEVATPAGASLRAILAALVPVHGGRLVPVPVAAAPVGGQPAGPIRVAAGFVTVHGAVAVAAAVLRELRDGHPGVEDDVTVDAPGDVPLDGARFALCHRPDLARDDGALEAVVGEALELLPAVPTGTLVLSPEAAAALGGDPGPNLRALELLALDGGADGGGSWGLAELVPASLDDVGRRREARVGGLRYTGRRRRPSGERAPDRKSVV